MSSLILLFQKSVNIAKQLKHNCFNRIIAKIDDEMLKYYCNEDMFLLEVRHSDESEDLLDILLVELMDH